MTKLEPVTGPDGLDEAQKALWDSVVSGRRAKPGAAAPSSLAGPFNPWMYAAGGGVHAARLGEYIRYETAFDDRMRELAILTVAAHYRADFEFWAHSEVALGAGVPESVIEAVRSGKSPGDGLEGDIHRAVGQLLGDGRIDDATYQLLSERLGQRGLVELVMLTGYYCLISMTLNVFDVRPPGKIVSYWPEGL